MKALIFSDLHIHDYKAFNRGNNSRLKVCLEVLQDLYTYAANNSIDTILFGGDLFDSPKLLQTVVVNQSLEALIKLADTYPKIVCYAISGNHDHSSKNLIDRPAVTALSAIAEVVPNNFIIVDNSNVVIHEELSVWGIPYYEYKENFKQRLDEVSLAATNTKQAFNLLLIHQTPTGLGNPNIPVDTDVNDGAYDCFDMVFCGHIHKRQEITPKFTLIGSTHHRDLGDELEEKGFYVIDTELKKKVFISTKGKYPEYLRVKVKIGEVPKLDPFNYVVPQIVEEISANAEGTIANENFDIDLTPEKLVENYCNQVAPFDNDLLQTGLECLTIKIED